MSKEELLRELEFSGIGWTRRYAEVQSGNIVMLFAKHEKNIVNPMDMTHGSIKCWDIS